MRIDFLSFTVKSHKLFLMMPASQQDTPPKQSLFIVGCTRSGTTLLGQILGKHPEIQLRHETRFFQHVWSQRHLLSFLPEETRRKKVFTQLLEADRRQAQKLGDRPLILEHQEQVLEIIERTKDLDEAFHQINRLISDKPIVSEKSPWHAMLVEAMLRRCDGKAQVLAICRDAPGAIASMRDRENFRRTQKVNQCIARWLMFNNELLRLQQMLPSEQFLLVRFEDLIQHPEDTAKGICNWLAVDVVPEMLQPTYRNSSFAAGPDAKKRYDGFDPSALKRWHDAFTPEEIRKILYLTAKTARKLGYERDDEKVPLAAQMAVTKELLVQKAGVGLMRSGFYPFGVIAGS